MGASVLIIGRWYYPDEALVLRLQHRSALLGQLNKSEGSEFVAVGAQFKF